MLLVRLLVQNSSVSSLKFETPARKATRPLQHSFDFVVAIFHHHRLLVVVVGSLIALIERALILIDKSEAHKDKEDIIIIIMVVYTRQNIQPAFEPR